MPFGVAAVATGAKAKAAPEAPKVELTAEQAEKLRGEREEFELNEEKVTFLELYSWYGKFLA